MWRLTDSPQWHSGEFIANLLDEWLRIKGCRVGRTSEHEERVSCLGDRRITTSSGKLLYLEYKSGIQTVDGKWPGRRVPGTGNVFLETISNDVTNAPGWTETCRAHHILYACVSRERLTGFILCFEPERVRSWMATHAGNYREVPTSRGQNPTYKTWGRLVPLGTAMREIATLRYCYPENLSVDQVLEVLGWQADSLS